MCATAFGAKTSKAANATASAGRAVYSGVNITDISHVCGNMFIEPEFLAERQYVVTVMDFAEPLRFFVPGNPCSAIAPTSPTPGIVIGRRNSSSSRKIVRICLSTSSWPPRRASTVPGNREAAAGSGRKLRGRDNVQSRPGGDGGDRYGTRAQA